MVVVVEVVVELVVVEVVVVVVETGWVSKKRAKVGAKK